ncbi:MAG: hypothetical protein KAQ67_02780, partial [Gammaproteobacteria bacterium]|nr:hypothetical protein [Gammaproteobacteria bacterium]
MPKETDSIDEFRPYIDDLIILSLSTNKQHKIYNHFTQLFENEREYLITLDAEQAQELLQTFSTALPIGKLITYSEKLGSIKAKDTTTPDNEAFVKTHFINKDTDLKQLISHISVIRSNISQYKINARTHYNIDFESNIELLSNKNRPSLINYYNNLYRPLLIADTAEIASNRLEETKKSYGTELAHTKLLANVENEKRIFRNITAESRLKDSLETYKKIINNTDDTEFIEFAKKEISRMYSNLAESNANDDNYEGALANARLAKEYLNNEYIEKQVHVYQKEISTKEVARLILTREEEDKISAQKLLKKLKSKYADDYSFILNKI